MTDAVTWDLLFQYTTVIIEVIGLVLMVISFFDNHNKKK